MNLSTILILIFSSVGLLDALYLSYHSITKTDVKCFFFPNKWCHKVQYSKYGKTLGIPNGYLGLVMYWAILASILANINHTTYIPFLWIQIVIGIGLLFSLYFIYIQAFVLRAFCTWCVLSAINFIVMAIAAFLL